MEHKTRETAKKKKEKPKKKSWLVFFFLVRLHTALQLKKWGEMWEIGRESLENGEAIADSYLLYVH